VARKVKNITLSADEQLALQKEYKQGNPGCFSRRCQMVLLKIEGYKSKQIGTIVGCCEMSVNTWIKRYEQQGIQGLKTKQGRGRKPILTSDHLPLVKAAVQAERQRLAQAQNMIESSLGKPMSKATLTRFLKLITAVTNE